MSSSDRTPQDRQDSVSLDTDTAILGSASGARNLTVASAPSGQSLPGSDVGPISQATASPKPISSSLRTIGLPTVGGISSPTSRGCDTAAPETSQEHVQPKFVTSTGNTAPLPPFSYNVIPRPSSTSGSPQQSLSSPVSAEVFWYHGYFTIS